jgi:hypothetical protein
MTRQQSKILDTLIYFLERYKNTVMKSESQTGFEEMVFSQMIDTVNDLREENKRLNELNKPKILKGDDEDDGKRTTH